MEFQIPINTLFTQVFGLAAPLLRKYTPPADDSSLTGLKYNINITKEVEEEELKTNLGTPVQFPMWFKEGSYNVINAGEIERLPFEELLMPYTSVATFSRAKRETETYMSGHKGSVIEQYGFEAWQIKIQGLIIKGNDKKGQSVADQIKELQKYEEISDSIEVRGKVFEWLKINHVYIKNINYPAARNFNLDVVIPFEMNLRSVEPIELILL